MLVALGLVMVILFFPLRYCLGAQTFLGCMVVTCAKLSTDLNIIVHITVICILENLDFEPLNRLLGPSRVCGQSAALKVEDARCHPS